MLIWGILRCDSGARRVCGNGCGLQMEGFSAHFEPYRFIFDNVQHFVDFAVDSKGLRLLPEGPVTPSSRVQSLVVGCKAQ